MRVKADLVAKFRTAVSQKLLHNEWIPVDQLLKFVDSEQKVTKRQLMSHLNKTYPTISLEPNRIEIDGVGYKIYRNHSQFIGKSTDTFYITSAGGLSPHVKTKNKKQKHATLLQSPLHPQANTNPPTDATTDEPSSLNKKRKHTASLQLPLRRYQPNTYLPTDEPIVEPPNKKIKLAPPDQALFPSHPPSRHSIYWKSGDARRLWAPNHDENCDVLEVVLNRIELLCKVNSTPESWRLVIEGADQPDADTKCSASDIFFTRFRSAYLAMALRKFVIEKATSKEPVTLNWKQCLQFAIDSMIDAGFEVYTSWETLSRWHRRLAQSLTGTFFSVPGAKVNLPPFFQANPDAMNAFKCYGTGNLKELSVEKMHEYVHEHLIPTLVSNLGRDDLDEYNNPPDDQPANIATPAMVTPEATKAFLEQFGLTTLSTTTVLRWMHSLGFRYLTRAKHYHVDGHEKPETRAYRPIFSKRYLELELRAHRWVQVSFDDAQLLEDQGLVARNTGYSYHDETTATDMVEYHVDLSESFPILPMGGNLSVRRPTNQPVVIFVGQDEAIFKQFLFFAKMWTGPEGQRALLPKDEGAGVMLSAFICREYGLIRELDADLLARVNAKRLGKNYADEEAAQEVFGKPTKAPLLTEKSPFLAYFEYGQNREGYWNYSRMVCQLEDVADVLTEMHPDYKFVFLFDQSSGHAKQRVDGLNVNKMNKNFGGKAPLMHESMIQTKEGFLGPFDATVKVGQMQSFIFLPTDSGPFDLTERAKEARRHDFVHVGKFTKVSRKRAELELDLVSEKIEIQGKGFKDVLALCKHKNIPTTKQIQTITEGWEGKPKGLLQILWERGWIDVKKLKKYTVHGTKDKFGIVTDLSMSLQNLMAMCHDFVNEEGMLQHVAAKIGVEVMLTPKCHAELAGEGVEYMWACAKNKYRSLALKKKRGKEVFMDSVRLCLSNEVITLSRIRKFARRARQYMIAYHVIDDGQVDEQTIQDCLKYGPVAVERLIVAFKTHRCAYDFDYKFVKLCCAEPGETILNLSEDRRNPVVL